VTMADPGIAPPADIAYARERDAKDPLGEFRSRFYLDAAKIYLDGNSLGLLSRDAESSLKRVIEEWKKLAIGGWMHAQRPWFSMAEELAGQFAPLLGAAADEVILHASTTVNIHALIATFYQPKGKRRKILIEQGAFPSDRYALHGQLAMWGKDEQKNLIEISHSPAAFLDEADIIAAMGDDVALVFLPSVLYRSGQLLDLARLSRAAAERQITIGFDCSHSLGAIPHAFTQWQVDFACWSTYKYCNSGPGGVAGMYINRRHSARKPALPGWFGVAKDRQFDMAADFVPADGAAAWQMGTPHILSLAPLEGALALINAAGIEAIRKKSLALTDYLIRLSQSQLSAHGFSIATPTQPARRGGHVALVHPRAIQINAALKAEGVVADYRPPNIIRIAPVALYNTFTDVRTAVMTLQRIVAEKKYLDFPAQRGVVA
jgi:kynureninase